MDYRFCEHMNGSEIPNESVILRVLQFPGTITTRSWSSKSVRPELLMTRIRQLQLFDIRNGWRYSLTSQCRIYVWRVCQVYVPKDDAKYVTPLLQMINLVKPENKVAIEVAKRNYAVVFWGIALEMTNSIHFVHWARVSWLLRAI